MLKLVKTVKTARFGPLAPEPSGMAGGAGALQCARYGKNKKTRRKIAAGCTFFGCISLCFSAFRCGLPSLRSH